MLRLRPVTPHPPVILLAHSYSCLPFPLLKAKQPLLFGTQPRATSKWQAQARTPLILRPILAAMSPSTESKTFQATRHLSSRVKKNNGQKSRRMSPQRCVSHSYNTLNDRTKSLLTRGSSLGSSSHTRSNGSTLTSESMTPISETSRLRLSRIISLASSERKCSHIPSMTRPSWSSTSRGSIMRETAPRLSTRVRPV